MYLNQCFALNKGEGTKCTYVEKVISTEYGNSTFLRREEASVKVFLESATKSAVTIGLPLLMRHIFHPLDRETRKEIQRACSSLPLPYGKTVTIDSGSGKWSVVLF